jgi:hypothetical protein
MALSGAAAGVSAVDLTAFVPKISASTDYDPDFPRLGLAAIGGDQTYPSANWSTYAKFHVVVINGSYEIWADARAYTREDVVTGIHDASSIGTKVFQYVDFNEISPTGGGFDPNDPGSFFHVVGNNNWWLYQQGSSGATVPSPFSSDLTLVNMTHFAPPNPGTGFYPYQAAAQYARDMFISGTGLHPGNAAPSLDGIYLDNTFALPRNDGGDWNRDGVSDSRMDPTVQQWLRTGELDFFTEMASLAPDKMCIGNIGSWPQLSTTDPNAVAPLNNVLSGGFLEAMMGASFSVETFPGFNQAMAYYLYLIATTIGSRLVMVNHEKLRSNGSDAYDATPYRAMRYGLCTALMNDGYYAGDGVNGHSGTLSDILWFDEYDAGGLRQGYLVKPTLNSLGAAQTSARWAYGPLGVWARNFSGGIAIVNPKGNGSQTLSLQDLGGPAWKKIKGTQDPTTNNGQDVDGSITLADRDGIILLRR